MKNDKPLETDVEEAEEETSDNSDDLFEEEAEADQTGSKDVASEEPEGLNLEKLKEITGRDFKDEEDFTKHYKNLNSYVGKKVKSTKTPKNDPDLVTKLAEIDELKDYVMQKDFLTDNPDAKDSLDLVKAYAKDKDLSLAEAWEKGGISKLVEANKAREDELEIGVKSKNRLNSSEVKKIGKLAEKVESGTASDEERLDLIRNFPGALK